MGTVELIGYLGGFTIAFALTPQVYKAWKTKSTGDISFMWNVIYIVGLMLYVVYGYGIHAMPIIVAGSLELLLAILLIVAKFMYG